jgi:hypothetical protein
MSDKHRFERIRTKVEKEYLPAGDSEAIVELFSQKS